MTFYVYSFSFHLSGLTPMDREHQALNQLLSLCFVREYDYRLHWGVISSSDRSVTIDVYGITFDDVHPFLPFASLFQR